MKRFYKSAGVKQQGGMFAVTLDGRAMKTPGGAVLTVPTAPLAEAIAAEWARQDDEIDLDSMHLTRLAYGAVDADRADVAAQVMKFAKSDLTIYRADSPAELVRRQQAAWDVPLLWVKSIHGAAFKTGTGIIHVEQPAEALAAIEHVISQRDMHRLVGLNAAAGILGSIVLALNLEGGRLDAASAFAAAHVDETYQAEKWGQDTGAKKRLDRLAAELASVETYLRLLNEAAR